MLSDDNLSWEDWLKELPNYSFDDARSRDQNCRTVLEAFVLLLVAGRMSVLRLLEVVLECPKETHKMLIVHASGCRAAGFKGGGCISVERTGQTGELEPLCLVQTPCLAAGEGVVETEDAM